MKLIFFRCDDVFILNKNFIKIYNIFEKNKIPLTCAVIPGRIENDTINFLRRKSLDVIQHGWVHRNYSNYLKKYEFGPSRNYKQQRDDIIKGKLKLEKLFGNKFTKVFVPPFHAFDFNTIKIVREEFDAISCNIEIKGFLSIPTKLSVNYYKHEGNVITKSYETLFKEFLKLYRNEKIIGLYFHSNGMDLKDIKNFEIFLKYLKAFAKKNPMKFCNIKYVLNKLKKG